MMNDGWTRRAAGALWLLSLAIVVPVYLLGAVSVAGTWKASFDSQIGRQDYTFVFVVKGRTVTGKIQSTHGQSEIVNGRVNDRQITFHENLAYQGTTLAIDYVGEIVSGDEIRFRRRIGELAIEDFAAYRVQQ